MSLLTYLFRPNPGDLVYADTIAIAGLSVCAALVVASFAIRIWKKKTDNAQVRKMGAAWATTAFWFGITGLILIVCRVEQIQFVAMRFWWVMWATAAALFVLAQARIFRARNYHVLPRVTVHDPRADYIPGKKRR